MFMIFKNRSISLLRLFLKGFLKLLFRVEVKGLDHFYASPKRTLIVANHASFLDGLFLFAFVPDQLHFAIDSHYANKWWVRALKQIVPLIPLDPENSMAAKRLIEHLRQERKCVIFPEGRMTVTGALMKIYEGPAMIADHSGAAILPIRLEGSQYTFFSHLQGIVRRKLLPKITLTILPSQVIAVDANIKGEQRHKIMANKIYDIMTHMMFEASPYGATLFNALVDAAHTHGMRCLIVEDVQRTPQTYRHLFVRIFILGRYLIKKTKTAEHVGILLPSSVGALVSFFGLHSIGRIPVMLNFSLSSQGLLDSCSLASVRLVLTSRRFVAMARLEESVEELREKVQILYLEDLKTQISLFAQLSGLIKAYFPNLTYRPWNRVVKPDDPAVILFTSGSEGAPKAVVLSHTNINANRFQIISLSDFNSKDLVLNVLPMFHGFGLTGGTLAPLLQGIRTFHYPSPLHYHAIPGIAYDIKATIFFATDTFLNQYARVAHPYDFFSIRYVFAGAEKLQSQTRQLWIERFGIHILEAYGATETAPALCINTRMYHKTGSVGRFLPAIQHYLKPIEGIPCGGQLFVKGPNVMRGYLDAQTKNIIPPSCDLGKGIEGGWYDTGDIVTVDEEGFVNVLGRIKRFAKIGGEMISLVAIEERLSSCWPDARHVMFSFPDARKGERLVLLTTGSMTREEIANHLKDQGLPELNFPKSIFYVNDIPLLATGKVDFRAARVMIEEQMGEKSGD